MKKFTEVTISDELRAKTDGMPVFRKCMPHETMLSFVDDDGNEAFKEWFKKVGAKSLYDYCEAHEEFKWLCKYQ